MLSKLGNLSIREILVVTSAYVRPPVHTLGTGRGVPRQPDGGEGGGECRLFLAGNRAVLLGNRCFFFFFFFFFFFGGGGINLKNKYVPAIERKKWAPLLGLAKSIC